MPERTFYAVPDDDSVAAFTITESQRDAAEEAGYTVFEVPPELPAAKDEDFE